MSEVGVGVTPFGVLQNYFTDLCYVRELDAEVLLYLFPHALVAWKLSVAGAISVSGAIGEFHAALFARSREIFSILGGGSERAISSYMVEALRDSLTVESSSRSPSLSWVPHWVGASCGLSRLAGDWFEEMENLSSPQLVDAYLSYVSRVVYRPSQNPLFLSTESVSEPWDRLTFVTRGMHWQESALASMAAHFSQHELHKNLAAVRDNASQHDGIRELVAADMLHHLPHTGGRAAELIENLSLAAPPTYWSDAFQ